MSSYFFFYRFFFFPFVAAKKVVPRRRSRLFGIVSMRCRPSCDLFDRRLRPTETLSDVGRCLRSRCHGFPSLSRGMSLFLRRSSLRETWSRYIITFGHKITYRDLSSDVHSYVRSMCGSCHPDFPLSPLLTFVWVPALFISNLSYDWPHSGLGNHIRRTPYCSASRVIRYY